MSEHDHQKALFEWAEYNRRRFPELRWLFAVPNGGKRDVKTARVLQSEGVKPGVPDVILPVARLGYHGLAMEMKYGKNKPTYVQMQWLTQLQAEGWHVSVHYNWQSAARILELYLSSTSPESLN